MHDHVVVIDDVAAGQFDRLDEVQRRLLAERTIDDHAAVVTLLSLALLGLDQVVAQHLVVLFDREHQASAHQQVDFRRRNLPRLTGAHAVHRLNQRAVLVVDLDRGAQRVVGDLASGQVLEALTQLVELVGVVVSANVVPVVLRHVEVAHVLAREQQLPHARQVADHVTDAGEQHAIDKIHALGEAQLDGRAWDATDVALIVGVAVDDFEAVASAHDAKREHARGMDDLARHIHRHVGDNLARGVGLFPLSCGSEIEVFVKRFAARDDFCCTHGQRFSQFAERFSRKARRPSTASWLAISSSR